MHKQENQPEVNVGDIYMDYAIEEFGRVSGRPAMALFGIDIVTAVAVNGDPDFEVDQSSVRDTLAPNDASEIIPADANSLI